MGGPLVLLVAGHIPSFGIGELAARAAAFGAAMVIGWTTQSGRLRVRALDSEKAESVLRAAAMSASASPRSCMIWSPTPSASLPCRLAWGCT